MILLISVANIFGGKNAALTGDFNGDVGVNAEDYEEKHGRYHFGVRNKEWEQLGSIEQP